MLFVCFWCVNNNVMLCHPPKETPQSKKTYQELTAHRFGMLIEIDQLEFRCLHFKKYPCTSAMHERPLGARVMQRASGD